MIDRWKNLVFPFVVAVILVGFQGWQWLERHREEQARKDFESAASLAVMATLTDVPTARVISINADRGRACGWVYLTPTIGAVPFTATSSFDDPADIDAFVPRLDVTDPDEWVQWAFAKQLNLVICEDSPTRDSLPPAPTEAHINAEVDRPIHALWDRNPPEWAIVPIPPGGFVALRREAGGGATTSPVFADRDEARQWTLGEGRALALARDTEGRKRMAKFDACLDKAANKPRGRHALGPNQGLGTSRHILRGCRTEPASAPAASPRPM